MRKLVLVLAVLLVVGLIAGCSTDNNQQQQQYYGGGGCGVGAPAEGNSGSDAANAVDNQANNL